MGRTMHKTGCYTSKLRYQAPAARWHLYVLVQLVVAVMRVGQTLHVDTLYQGFTMYVPE
jgi:hypothetical protein